MEYRRIYARIDLDALENNLNSIEAALPGGVGLMPVVKADAYGHGAAEIARFLGTRGAYFGVADMGEAAELRNAGVTKPILILGYTSHELYGEAVARDITLTVFGYGDAVKLDRAAAAVGKTAKVHVAIDTGMSRIGFQATDASADEVLRISELPCINVEGLFSHYATADEADKSGAKAQRLCFEEFIEKLRARSIRPRLIHMNNSAGIIELDGSFYDMARAGIILYGLYPSEYVARDKLSLMPVMELITHISHIKTLPEGRGISYGHTYVTEREMRIATIPVGYADGYPRALSGKGHVLISGVRCPILGRVCMDQMMADVSALPDVGVGDKVVLFGTDGDQSISVEELAALSGSFNYEFVCNIGRRVPRAYFRHGEHLKTVSYLEY